MCVQWWFVCGVAGATWLASLAMAPGGWVVSLCVAALPRPPFAPFPRAMASCLLARARPVAQKGKASRWALCGINSTWCHRTKTSKTAPINSTWPFSASSQIHQSTSTTRCRPRTQPTNPFNHVSHSFINSPLSPSLSSFSLLPIHRQPRAPHTPGHPPRPCAKDCGPGNADDGWVRVTGRATPIPLEGNKSTRRRKTTTTTALESAAACCCCRH